jgi:hypothetical protein
MSKKCTTSLDCAMAAAVVVVLDLDRGMAAMVGANERRGVVVIVFSDDSILVSIVGIASSLFMLRRRGRRPC